MSIAAPVSVLGGASVLIMAMMGGQMGGGDPSAIDGDVEETINEKGSGSDEEGGNEGSNEDGEGGKEDIRGRTDGKFLDHECFLTLRSDLKALSARFLTRDRYLSLKTGLRGPLTETGAASTDHGTQTPTVKTTPTPAAHIDSPVTLEPQTGPVMGGAALSDPPSFHSGYTYSSSFHPNPCIAYGSYVYAFPRGRGAVMHAASPSIVMQPPARALGSLGHDALMSYANAVRAIRIPEGADPACSERSALLRALEVAIKAGKAAPRTVRGAPPPEARAAVSYASLHRGTRARVARTRRSGDKIEIL